MRRDRMRGRVTDGADMAESTLASCAYALRLRRPQARGDGRTGGGHGSGEVAGFGHSRGGYAAVPGVSRCADRVVPDTGSVDAPTLRLKYFDIDG